MEQFSSGQHLVSQPMLMIDGDEATARSILLNPMVVERGGAPHRLFIGMWYEDRLTRTRDGWRICEQKEKLSYFHHMPDDFLPTE